MGNPSVDLLWSIYFGDRMVSTASCWGNRCIDPTLFRRTSAADGWSFHFRSSESIARQAVDLCDGCHHSHLRTDYGRIHISWSDADGASWFRIFAVVGDHFYKHFFRGLSYSSAYSRRGGVWNRNAFLARGDSWLADATHGANRSANCRALAFQFYESHVVLAWLTPTKHPRVS